MRDAVVALGYVERGEVTEAQLDEALDVTKNAGQLLVRISFSCEQTLLEHIEGLLHDA